MTFKQFIQLFVPPIYYKVKKRLFPKPAPEHHPLPKVEHKNNRMVVIGTGPSLNKTLELYMPQLLQSDCAMVNFSANTPLFEQLKPAYYVMMDPGWMQHEEELDEAINLCVDAIVTKTHWPMKLVLPSHLRSWNAIDEFKKTINFKEVLLSLNSLIISYIIISELNVYNPMLKIVLIFIVGYMISYIINYDWVQIRHS